MNRTLALAVIALSLAPQALAASGPTVTSAAWGTAEAPIEAAPGDTARPLTITIVNDDDDAFSSVRATLLGADGITPAPGGDRATLAGVFAPGDVWTTTFLVNVAGDAASTTSLPLRLTMDFASTLQATTRDLLVPVTLTGRPVISLAAVDDTIPSWSRVDVPIEVRNAGTGPAGGLTLRAAAVPGGALTTDDDGLRSVGGLAAGASRVVNVSVVTAGPGAAVLSLTLSYADAAGAPVVETRALALRVADESASTLSARLAGSTLEPGAPGEATFRIENAGSGAAHDVSVRLALPATASVLAGTDDQFLGDIAAGGSREARFSIRPSAAAGDLLDVALTLTWKDDVGVVHTNARKDALPLAQPRAGPLRMGLASGTLEAGRAGELVFDLSNAGAEPTRDVRVTFLLPPGAPTTPFTPVNATDSQELGDLAPGASTQATLDVLTSQSANDIYPIGATLSWIGADGIVRTDTFRFGALVRGTVQMIVTDGTALRDPEGFVTIAGTLTNLGNEQAHNAYLSVLSGGGFDATDPEFLGDLDPNSALPFSIDADATGRPAAAALLVTWNDDYGEIHEARFDTPLRPVEAASDDGAAPRTERTPGPAIPLVLGVAALAALLVRRKR